MMVRPRPSEEIVVRAPAKVNLILRVLDRRTDGYHNLWSLMQTVGLEDELRYRLRHDSRDVTLRCDDRTLPTDSRNLVHVAVTRILEAADRQVGVDISISKRIPVGGGLGGGSSDAAATIFALDQLLGLKWSPEEMARMGAALGSDVPFFFHAPTAIVRGRGEDIQSVRLTGQRWIVLVNPGFPIETRWAYERLSQMRSTIPPLAPELLAMTGDTVVGWENLVPKMENDFEAALQSTHPILGELKQALLDAGAETALLSGSGATVFGIFKQERSAAQSGEALRRWAGCRAYVVPVVTRSPFSQQGAAFTSVACG